MPLLPHCPLPPARCPPPDVNLAFYGVSHNIEDIVTGKIQRPPVAQPLYDVLAQAASQASERKAAKEAAKEVKAAARKRGKSGGGGLTLGLAGR